MTLHKTNANTTDNEKLKISLAASFLLSLTLFFFGPTNLYYTNIREMPFLFSNIWYYILAIVLVVGFILTLLLWSLKGSVHTTTSTLVFALGLLFWIQGNILAWDYGLLDGHEIIFENYFWNGVVDSLVWIGILIAVFLYSKRLYRHIAVLCSLLLIVQAIGLMATAYSAPEEPEWKNLQYSLDHKKMYEFSTKMNVIIIILDTFQSKYFQEIIDENSEYSDMFDGFTYYRNNGAGFTGTFPSIMYVLSGKLYDNSAPFSQFIKNTTLHNSLPAILKKNGVRVDVKESILSIIFPSNEIYDTIDGYSLKTYMGNSAGNISEITPIYLLTFFRFVPQAIKPYFYSTLSAGLSSLKPRGAIQNDMDVYSNFNSAISISMHERIFKLFHLGGVHPPFYLNENLSYENKGYKSQAKALLKISYALLESLKRNSIYDNSLIFIIGDHGYGSETDVVSRGTPLMLVKAFNSTGSLETSDSPVSLGDIPKTIADELKINNSFPGTSIFSVNETDSRVRIYYSWIWNPEYWADDYLPPLREYQISGFSWNASSWEPTYREYTSDGIKYVPPPLYTPDSIIHFGIGGDAEQYLTIGWSGPEKGFRWTNGRTAVFTCSLPKPKTDLMLNIALSPFLAADIKTQNLSIWMNEHKLQDVLLTRDVKKLTIVIPRNYFEEEIQRIKFDLPDAISPSELGISADIRTLGIAVRTLSMITQNDEKYD